MSAEFYSNCSSKKVQKKTVLQVLMIIVAYQNAKVLFKCDGKRVKTGISLFNEVKDNTEKKRWVNIISVYWIKAAGDNFSPYYESKKYFICEHHLKADKICVSLGIGWKTLKPGAIPSIFNFKNPS